MRALRLTVDLVAGILASVVLTSCRGPTTPPAPSGPPKSVRALARLEPAGGVINIGVPPGERPCWNCWSAITIPEPVRTKELLARLGSYPLRKAEYDLAVSQRDEARSQLAAIQANGAQELAQAKLRRQIVVEVEPLEIKAQKGQGGLPRKAIDKRPVQSVEAAVTREVHGAGTAARTAGAAGVAGGDRAGGCPVAPRQGRAGPRPQCAGAPTCSCG